MPKSQKPKSGLDAADSPDVEPAARTESGSDADAIMAALKRTEQCVLTKIDASVMEAAGKLHEKIDDLASDLRKEILNVSADFTKVTEEVQKENATLVTRVEDLEDGANGYANRDIALEAKVNTLSTQVTRLTDKTEDLESRQRRDNIRLVGVQEGVGNIRPENAVAELLKDARPRLYTEVRSGSQKPSAKAEKDGDAPRPIIAKFHYFQEKVDVLRKAMGAGPIFHNGKRFFIYPDYSAAVRKKRAAFTEVRRLLRRCPGVKYGLLYPATLKITAPAGEQTSFEDPTEVKHYIECILRPRETEGE